jgi:prepilin-type N-terminal cleavage/methylation domain-containing protein
VKRLRCNAGFTLVELLVAMTMGVVVLGAVGSLVVSAMKNQPRISERAQDISTARWVLERLTREIRNGIRVDKATASSVSFETYVRHTTCGGTTALSAKTASIKCEVTYTCTTTKCSRIEAAPGVYTGKATQIFEGIDSSSVFSYTPNATEATFVEVTLHMPNPAGDAPLTVSDGASLRNGTLTY